MKIVAFYNTNGNIKTIRTLESLMKLNGGHTEDEVIKSIAGHNEAYGYEYAKMIYVPDELDNVILFLLGDKQYKVYSDMENLDDSINKLNARIGSISEDVFDMRESFEHIEKMFKEFKDKLPNDE